jgi:hypothetical protein
MEDIITIEHIGKIIAIIATIYVIYKRVTEIKSLKTNKLKDDYALVEKILKDKYWETMHDYQLEYAYLALSGKRYEASVVRFFLSQNNPLKKLVDFDRGQKYLVPDMVDVEDRAIVSTISILTPLNNEEKYVWKLRRRTIYYFAISFIGWIPFVFFPNIMDFNSSQIGGSVMWILSFSMIALYFLFDISALESAKRISKLQQKEKQC